MFTGACGKKKHMGVSGSGAEKRCACVREWGEKRWGEGGVNNPVN